MKNLSRRDAMRTGAAMAVAGATATFGFPMMVKAEAGDSALIALVADFWKAYRDKVEKSAVAEAGYARMEAMPGYNVPHGNDKVGMAKWEALARASGYHPAWDISNRAGKKMGKAARAVFAVEARTLRGAFEKIKIARRACLSDWGDDQGDSDLECYQDGPVLWIDAAIADLERLAGVSATLKTLQPDGSIVLDREAARRLNIVNSDE